MSDEAPRVTRALRDTPAQGSPSAQARASDTRYGLPQDLLLAGARRLRLAALACSGVFLVVFAAMNLAPPQALANLDFANGVAAATVALSLAMFFAGRSTLAPEKLLDLGLLYEIAGAFGIALAETMATQHAGGVRGVSWVCLWITLFPLVVPSTPGKTFVAAVLSASMGPVAIVAAQLVGMPLPEPAAFVLLVTPNYAAAGLAVVFSRILHKLGTDVSRARQMGSYQLVELLGRGGMGEVWRAKHRMLAQPAAIKLVKPSAFGAVGDTGTVHKRFEREARAMAMLSSQHTVQIYDFGATDDGTLYYVMELLDGVDLETLIEEHGPLPSERAIYLLRQMCESLIEAHDHGLIHRDIKPANALVCKLGSRHDCLKVLDFGIVGLQSELGKGAAGLPEGASSEGRAGRLTADGAVTGTPAYMAPEVVTGKHAVDARVDLYALGCVAYWLLTGELVFEGKTAVQILYAHVEREPTPPSKRAGITLPEGLETLVLELLAKDPADRPASAREVAERLESIACPDPWSPKRAADWWESHPTIPRSLRTPVEPSKDTVVPV